MATFHVRVARRRTSEHAELSLSSGLPEQSSALRTRSRSRSPHVSCESLGFLPVEEIPRTPSPSPRHSRHFQTGNLSCAGYGLVQFAPPEAMPQSQVLAIQGQSMPAHWPMYGHVVMNEPEATVSPEQRFGSLRRLALPSPSSQEKRMIQELGEELKRASGKASPERLHTLLEWLASEAPALALSKFTTRLLQDAMDHAKGEQWVRFVDSLLPCSVELCKSRNGNHVVQKLVNRVHRTGAQHLLALLAPHALELARHQYGCRIFERLLEHFGEEEEMPELVEVLRVLNDNALELSQHSNGNYCLGALFQHGSRTWCESILNQLLPHIRTLAVHKVAPHVLRAAFERADAIEGMGKDRFLDTLLMGGLADIASSKYGSSFLQELREVASPAQQQRLQTAALEDA